LLFYIYFYKINNMKKLNIFSFLIISIFIYIFFVNIGLAQNFLGPTCAVGNCQGKIGVDSSGNISIGTSSPQSATRSLIIGGTNDSSTYALRILSSNSSPLLLVRNDGKISIATTSANYALNVAGDIYLSGNLVMSGSLSSAVAAGNVTPGVFNSLQGGGTGAYAFLGSLGVATTTQVGLPQTLSVYGGGYFSGNVGIGTMNPGAKLHIRGTQGNLAINTESVTNSIVLEAFNDANTTKYPILLNPWGGNVGIGTTTPAYKLDVVGQINSSGGLCISGDCKTSWSQVGGGGNWSTSGNNIYNTNTGNVGIGTTAPNRILHINTSSNWGSNIATIQITDSASIGSGITLDATGTSGRRYTIFSSASGAAAGAGKFVVYDTTAGTSRLVVDSSGNVGIGTTSPSSRLSVSGGDISISSGGSRKLWVGFGGYYIRIGEGDPATIEANQALQFRVNGNPPTVTAMHINTSGNIGIGTTTPAYKLDVVGDIRTTGCLVYNGGTLGSCASDINLKNIISPFKIDNALDKIIKLNPVKYTFKKDPSGQILIGLIAQEVEQFAPEFVTQTEEGKQIKYGDLQWLQIEAIKELKKENEAFKSKITQLEQEIQELKNK
jgi:hypothetical protein